MKQSWSIARRVRRIAESESGLRRCPFVCPLGTTRFRLYGFSWNLVLDDSSKIYWENFNFDL